MCKNGRLKKEWSANAKDRRKQLKKPVNITTMYFSTREYGNVPAIKIPGGGAIKKPVNITTTFFSTREYGNVPPIKIHRGGCY